MTNLEIKILCYLLMGIWALLVITYNSLKYLKEKWQSQVFIKNEQKIVYITPEIIRLKHQFSIDSRNTENIPKDYLLEDVSRAFAKELVKRGLITFEEIKTYEYDTRFSCFEGVKKFESELKIIKI